jgi:hypothetical protein
MSFLTLVYILELGKKEKKYLIKKLNCRVNLHDFYPAVAPKDLFDIGTDN